ncbi:MAG TPA: outer membrane beta-barrel protein [Methylocella sp.]|nr:outer membrane beta-barrel protein [Methylocella sp.]
MALSGAALAAEPAPIPPPPPPPLWTGFYVGLNAGGTWSNNSNVATVTGNGATFPGFDPLGIASAGLANTSVPVRIDGFIGGGQFGDNYQFANRWVGGFESDFQGIATSNQRTTLFSETTADVAGVGFPINQSLTASRRLEWLGNDRFRIGYLITPTFLLYGTGGLSYGETRASVALAQNVAGSPSASFGTLNRTLAGWSAGGGVEWLISPNWSLKVEYLYYDLGHVTIGMGPLVNSVAGVPVTVGAPAAVTRFNGNIVRAGLNYHIDFSMLAPIFARF